jgi:hypothetical protein
MNTTEENKVYGMNEEETRIFETVVKSLTAMFLGGVMLGIASVINKK